MYIPAIFETHPRCKLKKTEEVFVVGSYSFGSSPVADSCSEIVLQCVYGPFISYSEDLKNLSSESKYWFQGTKSNSIFQFYQEPVSPSEYLSLRSVSPTIDKESVNEVDQFIDVLVVTNTQQGMVPTTVKLTVGYYQIDQTKKRLINALVEFSGYINPSDFTNGVPIYTLNLNYNALSHRDLLIAFALPWHVYITMTMLVGFLGILMTIVFFLYHCIMSRNKKKEFFFWQYIKTYPTPNILGFLYSTFPQVIYIVIISVMFTQHLMTFKLNSLWCSTDDRQCAADLLVDKLNVIDIPSDSLTGFQRRRLGYLIIHAGIWIHYRTVQIITLRMSDLEKKQHDPTSYDNNVWSITSWKRFNYGAMNLFTVLLMTIFIYITFTNIFGENMWFFIVGFKALGEIMESTCELLFEDGMMLSSVVLTFNVMEPLCTFGAPDFLEFIKGFVLGLGIQLGERGYNDPMVGVIGGWIVDKVTELRMWIRIVTGEIKKDDDEEDDNGGKEKQDDSVSAKEEQEEEHSQVEIEEKKEDEEEAQIEQSQESDILITENSFNHADVDELERIAQMIYGAPPCETLATDFMISKIGLEHQKDENYFDSIAKNKHL